MGMVLLMAAMGTPPERGILAEPDGVQVHYYAYPSSLVVLPDGRLMCAYHGNGPAGPGSFASYSDDDGLTWSKPQLLIGRDGQKMHADPNVVIADKTVMVFSTSYAYKGGKADLSRGWTYQLVSHDSGRTWSKPIEFPQPHKYCSGMVHAGLKLPDGTLIMGYSWDMQAERGGAVSEEAEQGYRAGVLRSSDGGKTWAPGADIHVTESRTGADEPALVLLDDGTLYTLVRTGTQRLWETRSRDGGKTWDPPRPSPLVSTNCPAELLRLQGKPETVMVAYDNSPKVRNPLCVAWSTDGCRTWSKPKVLSQPQAEWQAGYPVACQTPKGTILVAWYEGIPNGPAKDRSCIRCARFDRDWLVTEPKSAESAPGTRARGR